MMSSAGNRTSGTTQSHKVMAKTIQNDLTIKRGKNDRLTMIESHASNINKTKSQSKTKKSAGGTKNARKQNLKLLCVSRKRAPTHPRPAAMPATLRSRPAARRVVPEQVPAVVKGPEVPSVASHCSCTAPAQPRRSAT